MLSYRVGFEVSVNHVIPLSKLLVLAGKWILGLNGAGLTVEFALAIAGYVIIPQVDPLQEKSCEALTFLSDTISGASHMAKLFALGGGFALLGIAIPGTIGVYRNLHASYAQHHLAPLNIGEELHDLPQHVVVPALLLRFFLVGASIILFGIIFMQLLYFENGLTTKRILSIWRTNNLACISQAHHSYSG